MTDTPAVSAPEEWRIEVDHSSYYAWLPVKDEDSTPYMLTVDSYWPCFRMRRTTVDEPTTTTTTIDVDSLRQENTDRAALGLSTRTDIATLARHLEDGPWPRHFPAGTITAIRADNPEVEAGLRAYFGVAQ